MKCHYPDCPGYDALPGRVVCKVHAEIIRRSAGHLTDDRPHDRGRSRVYCRCVTHVRLEVMYP